MNTVKLREALREFLGEERYRKFVADLFRLKQLRYWQEQRLQEFVALHPDLAADVESLTVALRVCELHGCNLNLGNHSGFRGTIEQTKLYLSARSLEFPHVGPPFGTALGDPLACQFWLCSECLAVESAWKVAINQMTVAETRKRLEQSPALGMSIDELTAALDDLTESDKIDN